MVWGHKARKLDDEELLARLELDDEFPNGSCSPHICVPGSGVIDGCGTRVHGRSLADFWHIRERAVFVHQFDPLFEQFPERLKRTIVELIRTS